LREDLVSTAVGERLSLGDGRGTVVRGAVVEAGPGVLAIEVDEVVHEPEPTPALWLVQALAKGDRDELAIQAATELGVDAVVPWAASRSVSRWEGAKVAKGRERWATIVREAAKQSIRAWTPEVGELATTKQVAALTAGARVLVLEPDASAPLTAVVPDSRDLVLVVGPEGGIAPQELALFREAGAEIVRLGSTVLRTSTAGPAALAVLNASLHRW